jgi:CO/xanthine dehydrogenase Mo-binding subunit
MTSLLSPDAWPGSGSENSAESFEEPFERVPFDFAVSRRSFVKGVGAGLLIAVAGPAALSQEGARRNGGGSFLGTGARTVDARLHIGEDGVITVLCGKVEAGQGARAELTQAAAEELGVPPDSLQMVLADTGVTPDDGMTAGSGSTPRTVPAVRRGAAAARALLIAFACRQWQVQPAAVEMRNGRLVQSAGTRTLTYADLARSPGAASLLTGAIPDDVALLPTRDWKVMGKPLPRPNGREIVLGAHRYPSDIVRPGMLYGKVLRPPAYGATLTAIDLSPARALQNVTAVQDGSFVGIAAPTSFAADTAIDAIARTAKWSQAPPQPSSKDLFAYLAQNVEGGLPPSAPADPHGHDRAITRTYHVPYIQHAPLEPRAAVAEWTGNRLTVWTGTQNPFGVRNELAQAFHLPEENVRVIVPDFGAAFGGKHTGECAVEAARLARGAGKPVSLRWTRPEEFTWAYFRPAALIQADATLDPQGKITGWRFLNINSGPNAVDTPYAVPHADCRFLRSKPPLRHGSYRGLAATANNFAREVFMDELAASAGADPLAFRLAHLQDARLRAVLQDAADGFGWREHAAQRGASAAIGLACGTEKGSYVAACAEVEVDRAARQIKVRRICQTFECGAIVNPENLLSQVQGAITMGLGAALREQMEFSNGKILNASFAQYRVPRFDDVPEMTIHLMDRKDLPSAGAGETPIIAIAPAIANAVFRATGTAVSALPIQIA